MPMKYKYVFTQQTRRDGPHFLQHFEFYYGKMSKNMISPAKYGSLVYVYVVSKLNYHPHE